MRKLDASVLRAQLLIGAVVLAASSGCAPPEPVLSSADRALAARALEYLRTTDHEMGMDVLAVVHSFGELADEPLAFEVVDARLEGIRPAERARFGRLLDVAKPPFPASTLEGVPPPTGRPEPSAALGDRRVQTCVEAMMECAVPPECLDYALLDSWGYVLTHQAVWLLFAGWLDCALPVDAEALRHRYAARLVAEARFDPAPSDLFFERLGVLGHLGFGGAIEPEWVTSLREAQQREGCFPVGGEGPSCHPHPTALALWTLVHAARAGQ